MMTFSGRRINLLLSLPDNLKSAINANSKLFLPYVSPVMVKLTVDELRSTGLVNKIYLLASDSLQAGSL